MIAEIGTIRGIDMEYAIPERSIRFTSCGGGYIATDGLRMCKITFEERLRIDKYLSDGHEIAAHIVFMNTWRQQNER